MTPKDWLAPAAALLGILISTWINAYHTDRRRLNDARLECYADWVAVLHEVIRAHLMGESINVSIVERLPSLDAKLKMLEPDPALRAFIAEISHSFPREGSVEYARIAGLIKDGQFWVLHGAFETKMNELILKVHASMHRPWWRVWGS
jgi:hypothetical protein